MDRIRIETAARLLAKAYSTDSEAEATALVDKASQLLDRLIEALPANEQLGTGTSHSIDISA